MRIETHEGTFADPATFDDIPRAVAELTSIGEAFIILSAPHYEMYLQAAGTVAENFIIERRAGGAGDHYRGDRRVTADELVALLTAYMAQAVHWDRTISWHRVRVDAGYDTPSA